MWDSMWNSGFDCPSCDLCLPGCLPERPLAPTRAIVWLSGVETVGPDLQFLRLRLFLHLHLWPCCQPLTGLSGLFSGMRWQLVRGQAGLLNCQSHSAFCCSMQEGSKVVCLSGGSFPRSVPNWCLPVCRLCHPLPAPTKCNPPFGSARNLPPPGKHPTHFRSGCSRPVILKPTLPWSFGVTKCSSNHTILLIL